MRSAAVLLLLLLAPASRSEEVTLADEWRPLGANDTVPQGAHVRMDVSTGEKWAKKMRNDDDDESRAVAVAVDPAHPDYDYDYDYEMMHRTLSKLPLEERERMGLPRKDAASRAQFENKMRDIWEGRQKRLREMEDAQLDLPEVLKDRITRIKAYLKDPLGHLRELVANDESEEPQNTSIVTHIISVLKDLEFQLCDVDMTRDFHTLGGWPVLVKLLDDKAHLPHNRTALLETEYAQLKSKSYLVRAHAAWAIGSAVKNTGEFYPYAVEPVGSTTAIDALIDLFCDIELDDSDETKMLSEKAVYGIGSLLRGNTLAIRHVAAAAGPERIGAKFARLASGTTKLTHRLLALCGDVISHGDHRDDSIVRPFASGAWCDGALAVSTRDLSSAPPAFREAALRASGLLAPHCDWDAASKAKAVDRMRASGTPEDSSELRELAENAIEALESKTTAEA